MDSKTDDVLTTLRLRTVPKPKDLLASIKEALNDATLSEVWDRMEHNHRARFCVWDGHDRSCRKADGSEARPFQPGMSPHDIFPWPGAADLEVKLVDEIIQEHLDLLAVAVAEGNLSIVPSGADVTDDQRMKLAEAWGGVAQYYEELGEMEHATALVQWADAAWEYGHGIVYIGWREEAGVESKTMSGEDVLALFTASALQAAMAREMAAAAAQGREPEMIPEEEQAAIEQEALMQWESLLMDPAMEEALIEALMGYDPELQKPEARRLAKGLRKDEEVTYYVPQVQRRLPDVRALTPGLDVFYPVDTRRIQEAPWVVMAEWLTEVELRARVDEEDWDKAMVEALIAQGPMTNAEDLALVAGHGWVLARTMVGTTMVQQAAADGQKLVDRWQVLTVHYKAQSIGSVPAIYKTVISTRETEKPLKHEVCKYAHGRYPFADYVREFRAPCLWDSRGVGELSFSEQEELRVQANYKADNATISIAPPVEVRANSLQGRQILRPRAQFQMSRTGDGRAVQKIDVSGDPRGTTEVEQSALERSNRYWLRGPNADPVAKLTRQKRIVREWLLCVKQAERLRFQTIQQYADDRVKAYALGGRAETIDVSREDIQGGFSLAINFDVATLDMKTVESRMKLLREYVVAMDKQGLLKMDELLKLATMMINPQWAKLMVSPKDKAEIADAQEIGAIVAAALNGVELPYVGGKNHAARAAMMEQMMQQPAMDARGQPIVDGQTGQPVPGRVARIMNENPDVAELLRKRLEFESFQAEQKENADIGRSGVEPGPGTGMVAA